MKGNWAIIDLEISHILKMFNYRVEVIRGVLHELESDCQVNSIVEIFMVTQKI